MTSDEERTELATRRVALWRRRALVRVRHAEEVAEDEIAAEAGCSPAAVRRDIRYLHLHAGDPPVTPSLLISRRTIGEIDTPALMGALRAWPYTPTIYAPYPATGSLPGSWAEVQQARFNGGLTQDEYESLLPLAPDGADSSHCGGASSE